MRLKKINSDYMKKTEDTVRWKERERGPNEDKMNMPKVKAGLHE